MDILLCKNVISTQKNPLDKVKNSQQSHNNIDNFDNNIVTPSLIPNYNREEATFWWKNQNLLPPHVEKLKIKINLEGDGNVRAKNSKPQSRKVNNSNQPKPFPDSAV